MGNKSLYQIQERESSSLVCENRILLTKTLFKIIIRMGAWFKFTIAAGVKSKVIFTRESPNISSSLQQYFLLLNIQFSL